ncbi:uncharacterized protein PFLUO_LOCUS2227, partial [Penicillium psychrofluorescens]|uniref:uncharacterized protein n=1 Tax=Penicillium psychrofluorescens TaxID=3158075 RepID=UPI003CCDFFC4
MQSIEREGLHQFQDVTILVQGKNLKTLTKGKTWEMMVQQFERHWGNVIDESFLSDQFYFDIGKETYPTSPSQ